MTWSVTWPAGPAAAMLIDATARDVAIDRHGIAEITAEANVQARVGSDRIIQSLPSAPELVGAGAGRGYRPRLRALVPDHLSTGTLTYCLLDELPGVTLVAPIALSRQPELRSEFDRRRQARAELAGVCAGWRADGIPAQRMATGGDPGHNLVAVADRTGAPGRCPRFRRRRRTDVVDGSAVVIDSHFRDSMWEPDGTELVVHEYGLGAVASREPLRLDAVTAEPRVLPFSTCVSAAQNVDLVVGEPLATLRQRVPQLVTGTAGCTHLNDVMRALADVPVLLAQLKRRT